MMSVRGTTIERSAKTGTRKTKTEGKGGAKTTGGRTQKHMG